MDTARERERQREREGEEEKKALPLSVPLYTLTTGKATSLGSSNPRIPHGKDEAVWPMVARLACSGRGAAGIEEVEKKRSGEGGS